MNPKVKLLITLIIALVLIGLFFLATKTISSMTGYSITGSSVSSVSGGFDSEEIEPNQEDGGDLYVTPDKG